MRGTICIVESDHIIRLWLVSLLQEADFQVVDFDSADGALIHLRRHAAGVIMILSAVDLPGIFNGSDLVRVARLSWPRITIVVAQEAGSVNPDVPAGTIIMTKPLEEEEVLGAAHLADQREVLWRIMKSRLDGRSSGTERHDVPSSAQPT
jgi:FixJ family two-component response regulator